MDEDGPDLAGEFYKHLFQSDNSSEDTKDTPDITRSAYALHKAVENLRSTGVPFSQWAPFIHLGL